MDSDLYYHLAVAKLYSQIGKIEFLPWGNDWIFKSGFGDTHLLFHQVLRLQNLLSVKLIIAILVAFNVTLFIAIHKPISCSQTFGYSLLFLFGSYIFTGRFLFAKGLLLFLPIFILYYYFWKKKSAKSIFLLSFLAVWTYPLAPLIILYSIADLFIVFFRSKPREILWIPILLASSGFVLGIVVHPSFPYQYGIFYLEWFQQIFQPKGLEKIAEWTAPSLSLYFYAFNILILLGIRFIKDTDKTLGIIFLLGVVSSYFTTKSIEWAAPIGFLWIASSRDFRKFLNHKLLIQLYIPILFLGSAVLGQGVQIQLEQQNNDKRYYASYLCRNLSDETKIWLNWENFQEFVYECPNKIYPFGMNPLYAYANDNERYNLIQKFWFDYTSDNTNIPIYLGYNAVVIFPERDSNKILNNMLANSNWELKFRFNYALVFLYKKKVDNTQDRNIKIINKNFILPNNGEN